MKRPVITKSKQLASSKKAPAVEEQEVTDFQLHKNMLRAKRWPKSVSTTSGLLKRTRKNFRFTGLAEDKDCKRSEALNHPPVVQKIKGYIDTFTSPGVIRILDADTCGSGKTSAAAALLACRRVNRHGVVFAAQRVSALDAMGAQLIALGTKRDDILCYYGAIATGLEKAFPNTIDLVNFIQSFRVVLLTHRKITSRDQHIFLPFNGTTRSLLVVDESLPPVVCVSYNIVAANAFIERCMGLAPSVYAKLSENSVSSKEESLAAATADFKDLQTTASYISSTAMRDALLAMNYGIIHVEGADTSGKTIELIMSRYFEKLIGDKYLPYIVPKPHEDQMATILLTVLNYWSSSFPKVLALDATPEARKSMYNGFTIRNRNNNLSLLKDPFAPLLPSLAISKAGLTKKVSDAEDKYSEQWKEVEDDIVKRYKGKVVAINTHKAIYSGDTLETIKPRGDTAVGRVLQNLEKRLKTVHFMYFGGTRGSNAYRNAEVYIQFGHLRIDGRTEERFIEAGLITDWTCEAFANIEQDYSRTQAREGKEIGAYLVMHKDLVEGLKTRVPLKQELIHPTTPEVALMSGKNQINLITDLQDNKTVRRLTQYRGTSSISVFLKRINDNLLPVNKEVVLVKGNSRVIDQYKLQPQTNKKLK